MAFPDMDKEDVMEDIPFGNSDPVPIGRVLRASTQGFVVGCQVRQLSTPSFGCLVKAQPIEAREVIFGLLYDMNVADDPLVRRLILADNHPEAVINDQRQNRLLPIEMSVLAVGYRRDDLMFHGLPPRPPLNLDPVILCADLTEISRFTDRLGYLRLILRAANLGVPVDQLLVAHVQDVYRQRGGDVVWAAAVIGELVELLRSDYDTLVPVLEAIGEALPELGGPALAGGF
jgi:hypothetical protein